MKFLFLPVSILGGLLAGLIGKKIFEQVWGLIDDQEPPEAKHREIEYPKLAGALLLEGAIFRLVRGFFDHGVRHVFERFTGSWPGEEEPERESVASSRGCPSSGAGAPDRRTAGTPPDRGRPGGRRRGRSQHRRTRRIAATKRLGVGAANDALGDRRPRRPSSARLLEVRGQRQLPGEVAADRRRWATTRARSASPPPRSRPSRRVAAP